MRMYLISDNTDTLTGMRLAGIEGVVAHSHEEVKNAPNIKCPSLLKFRTVTVLGAGRILLLLM